MSFKRALLTLSVGLTLAAVAPAVASAAVTLSVVPSSQQAGGHPNIVNTVGLDNAAGAATGSTFKLAPGLLANLNANPACLAAVTHTVDCQIGDGTISPVAATFTAYLVPSTSPTTNVAGIDLVVGPPISATLHAELALTQTSSGNVQGVITLGPTPPGLTGITLNLDGTLPTGGSHAGAPFTQMPTNCATPNPHSHIDVQYAVPESADASPDIAPTGCSSLPYAPSLSGTAVRDSSDPGVALTTVISQTAGQANNAASTLSIPAATVSPNAAAIALTCTSSTFSGCTSVGTASVSSPLFPTAVPGKAYLTNFTGTPPPGCPAATFGLTVAFPAPLAFNLCGVFENITTSNPDLKFSTLPDLPISSLAVSFNGGPNAAFVSSCSVPNGTLSGAFTGQNGVSRNVVSPITVQNCPSVKPVVGKPTAAGASITGIKSGHPKVKVTLKSGSNAPKIKKFTVKLPGGLKLTKKFKKGLSITGGGKFTATKSGNTLKVTLKGTAGSVTVTLKGKALTVTKGLQKKVKNKKVKKLKLVESVTDAVGATTNLTENVKVS